MFDLTLQQCILRFCAIVFIAAVHGAAVAGIASVLGDRGPRQDGRLSLNPFVHLDLLGTVSAVLFSIGWIKPVAIDPAKLRLGRLGLPVVVVVGLAATILGAYALWLARPAMLLLLPDSAAQIVFAEVETIEQLSAWFALLNVLPIPCLTGGHILTAVMPQWRDAFVRAQPYAAIGLIVLIAAGRTTGVLDDSYNALARLLPGN